MKQWKFKHLKFSNALFLLSFFVTFLLMSFNAFILFNGLNGYITGEINRNQQSRLESTAETLENNLQQACQAARMLAQNDEFIQYLKRAAASQHSERMMRNMFYRYTYGNESVSSLVIVTKGGALLSTDESVRLSYEDVLSKVVFSPLLDSSEPVLFVPAKSPEENPTNAGFEPENTLFFGVPIVEEGTDIAYMLILLKNEFIESSIGESMAVRYNDSNMIASSAELSAEDVETLKKMDAKVVHGLSASYYSTDFYDGRFTLFCIYPKEMLSSRLLPVILAFLAIFLLSVLFSLLISRLLSSLLVRPIRRLSSAVNSYLDTQMGKFSKSYGMYGKNLTFREGLMLNLTFAVFLPLIIFNLMYIPLLRNTTKEYLIEQSTISCENTYAAVASYFENKQNCLRAISSDYRVQDVLYDTIYQRIPASETAQSDAIYKMLEAYQILYSNHDLIYVSDSKGNPIFATSPYDPIFSPSTILSFGNFGIAESWKFDMKSGLNQDVFGYFYRITDVEMGDSLGTIQCVIQESDLRQRYDVQRSQYLDYYLTDNNGSVVSSTQTRQIGSALEISNFRYTADKLLISQESDRLVFTKPFAETGLILVMEYSLDSLSAYFTSIFHQQLIVMAACLCIIIALAYMFSIRMTNPLTEFYKTMEKIGLEFDGISSMLPQFSEDSAVVEINQLGKSFNAMAERIELLLDEIITASKKQGEIEMKKKTAEILALQSQINSHFLYNTFENINSCIAAGQNDVAITMIDSLSLLLRYSSKVNDLLVPLREELSCLEKYLYLMGVRFGDKIRFSNKISNEYRDVGIVRLSLQPIVENAITHGILPKERGGHITLSLLDRQDQLEIDVCDDGIGIAADHLQILNEQLEDDSNFDHIGLFNVNDRIKIALGKSYGLSIESRKGEGTLVRIQLPKIHLSGRAEEEDM